MIRNIYLTFLFWPVLSFANQTEFADIYEVLKKGALPYPYENFSLHIFLNEEDHSLANISILVGGVSFKMPKDKMLKIKNVDLGSVFVGHEIYRNEISPYHKTDSQSIDYFILKLLSYDGLEREHTWYADYYSIVVNLESGEIELSKTEHAKP